MRKSVASLIASANSGQCYRDKKFPGEVSRRGLIVGVRWKNLLRKHREIGNRAGRGIGGQKLTSVSCESLECYLSVFSDAGNFAKALYVVCSRHRSSNPAA